ncbi:MAG: hypothetical protein H6707_10225 [Deltaproteobacteria bacterium]|nr:hypothetical protein [Deltaproteobacteria bacterium]
MTRDSRSCGVRCLVLGLLLSYAGCATETIELFADAQPTKVDATVDGASLDAALDQGQDGSLADLSVDATIDASTSCVCRYNLCRTNAECQPTIGPTSSCQTPLCSGAVGSCRQAADCGGTGWLCTTSATSLTPCP